jgi:hypothetical protein
MGPRAVLDAVEKRRIPSPRRESNPRTLIVYPDTFLQHDRYTSISLSQLRELTVYISPNSRHGRVLLEKLIVTQFVRQQLALFMESEG